MILQSRGGSVEITTTSATKFDRSPSPVFDPLLVRGGHRQARNKSFGKKALTIFNFLLLFFAKTGIKSAVATTFPCTRASRITGPCLT